MDLRRRSPEAHHIPDGDVDRLLSKREYMERLKLEQDVLIARHDNHELTDMELAQMLSDIDEQLFLTSNSIGDIRRDQRGDKLSVRRKIGHFFFGR